MPSNNKGDFIPHYANKVLNPLKLYSRKNQIDNKQETNHRICWKV